MYHRDKNVEKAESLERILIALDRLTEVVSKEETQKEILASLKEKGAKDVRDVPTANDRADEIQYSRTRTPRQSGNEEQGEPLNFGTMRRLNDAFKALQGDVGGFQRTLVTAINGGQKLKSIMDNPNLSAKAFSGEGAMTATAFRKKYIADLRPGEYMNRLTPDMTWMHNRLTAMEKSGLNIQPGGSVYKDALENARLRSQDKFDREVEAKYAKYKDNLPRPQQGLPALAASEGVAGISTLTLARAAVTVAAVAAPIVAGKMIHSAALSQIEGNRPFAMLNGQLATGYAMYDYNKLMGNMRVAQGISPSMQSLLKSETEFSKTLEPMRVATNNLTNKALKAGLDAMNTVLKPISAIVDYANKTPPLPELEWYEKLANVTMMLMGKPAPFDRKVWTEEDVKKFNDAAKAVKGPIQMFADEIGAQPVCPAQRFVP